MPTPTETSILHYLRGPRPLQEGSLVYEPSDGTYYVLQAGFSIPPIPADWVPLSTGGTGDVVGPGASTDNAIVRWDGITGTVIQNSTVIIDDSGNITAIGNLSLTGFEDFAAESAPSVAPSGHARFYFDSGSNTLKLSENGGAYTNVLGSGGDVVGPSSATDNAICRFDSTTGKLIQNSLVIISDTGDVSGVVNLSITGFEDWTEEAAPSLSASGHGRIYVDSTSHTFKVSENGGAYVSLVTDTSNFVVGPVSSTDNAVCRFDSTTGKLIQNSVVIIGDTGVVTGVTDFNLTGFEDFTEEAAPSVSASGHSRLYADSSSHTLKLSQNGAAYVNVITDTSGFVTGPGSATDTAFARYNGTTGKIIENSGVLCDGSNNVSGIGSLSIATFEDWTESAAPSASASGHGRMYIDSTSHVFRLSENAGSYFTIGDVRGPSSATDNAVARFDATTGKLIQNSGITIDDSNNLAGIGSLSITSLTITGSLTLPYTANGAGNYNILTTDFWIGKTGITGGGDTLTLPAASGNTGKAFVIHDESGTAATNNITINVASSGTIDGQSSIIITANNGTLRVFCNGSSYDSW